MASQCFSAGIARCDLPLNDGLELSGYVARIQPSLGVHDSVSTTSLALANDDVLLLIISVDVLGFAIDVATGLRERLKNELRQRGSWRQIEICLAGTHTHSAPASMNLRGCGTASEPWLAQTCETVYETVLASVEKLEAARLGTAQTEVEGVSLNRRGSTPVDNSLGLWRIEREDGSPLAAVLNFACHPVVYDADNVLVSAEYPGAVRRELEPKIGAPVVFLTGAAGDINPLYRGGDEEIERTSSPIAAAAEKLWPNVQTSDEVFLGGESRVLDLPLCELAPRAELEALAADETFLQQSAWAKHALSVWGQKLSVPCAVQVLRVDGAAVVGVGCELFVSLGSRIKSTLAAQGFESVLIAGYANGNLGYVPDAEAYSKGGYEVDSAHFYYAQPACVAPDGGAIVVRTAEQLGQSLAEF